MRWPVTQKKLHSQDTVYDYLAAAFSDHGAPLVLKHDGGCIFHGDRIRGLLAEHRVVDLTGPPSPESASAFGDADAPDPFAGRIAAVATATPTPLACP